jgi:uncharacterized protein YheU (UPF0270 family)
MKLQEGLRWMAQFVKVPPERLQSDVLHALLEEYATRDGTDYGEREQPLEHKVARLRGQLEAGDVQIVYDVASEQWDLLPRAQAEQLLNEY